MTSKLVIPFKENKNQRILSIGQVFVSMKILSLEEFGDYIDQFKNSNDMVFNVEVTKVRRLKEVLADLDVKFIE